MTYFRGLLFVVGLAGSLYGPVVAGQGAARAFDCAKAYLPVDFVICSDPAVLKANEAHEKAWYETRARLNETEKQELLADQRQWLKEFPPRCGVPARGKRLSVVSKDTQLCVAKALEERKIFLEQYHPTTTEAQPSAVAPTESRTTTGSMPSGQSSVAGTTAIPSQPSRLIISSPALSYEIKHPYFDTNQAKTFAQFQKESQQKITDLDREIAAARSEAGEVQSQVVAAQAELRTIHSSGKGSGFDNFGILRVVTGFNAIANFTGTSIVILQFLSFIGFILYIFYLRWYNREKWTLLISTGKLSEFWRSHRNQTVSIFVIATAVITLLPSQSSAQMNIFQQIEWRYFGKDIQKGYIALKYGPERPLSYLAVGSIPIYGPPYTQNQSWPRRFDLLAHEVVLKLPIEVEEVKTLLDAAWQSSSFDHIYALIDNTDPKIKAEILSWRIGKIRQGVSDANQEISEYARIADVLRAVTVNSNFPGAVKPRTEFADALDALV